MPILVNTPNLGRKKLNEFYFFPLFLLEDEELWQRMSKTEENSGTFSREVKILGEHNEGPPSYREVEVGMWSEIS
jgi:hypothetical protein